ncbi:MAG: NYN domain-containing protein [Vicinamibacteria bacterium]|nr:NYN domain-containing protein [Vicinamibacteria bacterium]
MSYRALVLIDGNNFYHRLTEARVDPWLNYASVSKKIIGDRTWVGTRYYVGQMPNTPTYKKSYDDQRKFIGSLCAQDPKISSHFGRMEFRYPTDPAAKELRAYIGSLRTPIDPAVRRDLMEISKRHHSVETLAEKAVDVMLSVDLVVGASRDEFDAAYILSADGDYTPAVAAVRGMGKRVFAASLPPCAQLAAAVDTFIPLNPGWFVGCY